MSDLSDRVRQRIRDYEAGVGSKVIIIAAEDAIMRFIDEESDREEQDACKWNKGLHSYETCWSDVLIKDYKRYAMKFCPHCGRKIKVI